MKGFCTTWPYLIALATLTSSGGQLRAGDLYDKTPTKAQPTALPKAAEIQSFAAYPTRIDLKGMDDAHQLLLTATLTGGGVQDLTSDTHYEVEDTTVARITPSGRVLPVGNGSTEIVATFAGKTVRVPVSAQNCDVNLPINFGNQIVPIFTKLGCNSGGCHGRRAAKMASSSRCSASSRRWITWPWSRRPVAGDSSWPLRTTVCCC